MTHKTCPSCGKDIEADDPHGLCPACLLKQGLSSETADPSLGPDGPFEGDPLRKALEAKLQGQYRVIRLLGHGGMGAVYLARDLTLDREVAIKVVKTASDGREMYVRFRHEAKTAAKLSHPNIVPLHAFGEVEGMPYFVMGYVRGESLAARLRREGRLPEEEARRVFAEIADALDHAHRQGVIHRDIKPDNVLLDDESGGALLTDFGVAKAAGKGETLTRLGHVVGTPHYMSPEQASGRSDIDGRSDLYSLGVMAYAMLAGRLPFEGNTPAEVLTKHLTQEPAPLRSVAPTVSDATALAIERCLAKDPAARWQDARSVKLSLGATEESQLPPSLQNLEGGGVPGLLFLIGYLFFATLVDRLTGAFEDPDLRSIHFPLFWYGLVPFLCACFYFLVVSRLRREGFSVQQSQLVTWREPVWWPTWYPRSLRRRGNVWDRLPPAVRSYRLWPFALILYGSLLAVAGATDVGDLLIVYKQPMAFAIGMGGLGVVVLVWFALAARARRELRRGGLAGADIPRVLLSVPPSRMSFWTKPHIEAILASPARPETGRASNSPHDHLQSILRHAEELSGPLRPLGAQAAVAARQLVAAIDDVDRQIAELSRYLEPGEEERLAEKIESLAAPATGHDELAPMRTLLEQQLDLIRELSARIEEARGRRTLRMEMLRTLALHVASLRARVVNTPSEVSQISDNVRALCDDIGRHATALDTKIAAPDFLAQMTTVERRPS